MFTFLKDDVTYGVAKTNFMVRQGKYLHIVFNVKEETNDDGEIVCVAEKIEIPCQHSIKYGELVSALIRCKYSADDVEAIVLNGEDTIAHAEELQLLKEWRIEAKKIAKEILGL